MRTVCSKVRQILAVAMALRSVTNRQLPAGLMQAKRQAVAK
jgi:hypothetical protein